MRSQHLSCSVLKTRTKPHRVPGIMEYGTGCQWEKKKKRKKMQLTDGIVSVSKKD